MRITLKEIEKRELRKDFPKLSESDIKKLFTLFPKNSEARRKYADDLNFTYSLRYK